MSKSITIIAPPGSLGEHVWPALARRVDVGLRLLLPTAAPPVDGGVDVRRGELSDVDFVVAGTRGTDSLLWLTPMACGGGDDPVAWHRQLAEVAVQAIDANAIPQVVHASSHGAGPNAVGRALEALTLVEEMLEASSAAVTQVRAAWVMENFSCQLDAICQTGSVYLPVGGQASVPLVSCADLARTVSSLLVGEPTSETCFVVGPDRLSFDAAAGAIGRGMGRVVEHVEVPVAQVRQALVAAGACRWGAELLAGMAECPGKDPHADHEDLRTINTETSLEAFARETLAPLVASCGT